MRCTAEQIRRAPKVLLHDHLDGGVRAATVADLAAETGYTGLPSAEADGLTRWFADAARAGSLESYLARMEPIVAVLQTEAGLRRVAAECVADLAADSVVYAEVKIAPEQHTAGGLTLDQVVAAVVGGLREGEAAAAARGRRIRVRLLVTALRQAARSMEIAELAVRHRERGVIGFDIAGPEAGHPPTRHLAACEEIKRANFHLAIHAGEGFGLTSIWEAVQWCGAERLGHGLRIIDDIGVADDGSAKLGQLAAYVRDRRIPLEMCPLSNVHTGAVRSIVEHPIATLRRLRFRVTVNTDNRLLSTTSLTREFTELVDAFGYGVDDLQWFTVNAVKSAFLPHDERLALISDVIKPAYSAIRNEPLTAPVRRGEDNW
jgi:adenosine deaminase